MNDVSSLNDQKHNAWVISIATGCFGAIDWVFQLAQLWLIEHFYCSTKNQFECYFPLHRITLCDVKSKNWKSRYNLCQMFLGPAIWINCFANFQYISVSTIDLLGPGQHWSMIILIMINVIIITIIIIIKVPKCGSLILSPISEDCLWVDSKCSVYAPLEC